MSSLPMGGLLKIQGLYDQIVAWVSPKWSSNDKYLIKLPK